jgi:hypothetical protein
MLDNYLTHIGSLERQIKGVDERWESCIMPAKSRRGYSHFGIAQAKTAPARLKYR